MERALPSAKKQWIKQSKQISETSSQLVEQLVQSSGAVKSVLDDFQQRAPKPVWEWTKQQYKALKDSGLLEEAASRAMQALEGELEMASAFLPYLDAIEKVRKQQMDELNKRFRKNKS